LISDSSATAIEIRGRCSATGRHCLRVGRIGEPDLHTFAGQADRDRGNGCADRGGEEPCRGRIESDLPDVDVGDRELV
jgi:hypothetical protein